MGYSGSVYTKIGTGDWSQVFREGKFEGGSCMIYPQIYNFNRKTELSIEAISKTVDMLNNSAGSYHELAYDLRKSYELISALGSFMGISFREIFDKDENLLLIPRIESSDSCGNSELVSFYEKNVWGSSHRLRFR